MSRAALALVALLGACAGDSSRFVLVVTVATDDGRPLPDMPVLVNGAPAGKTDAQGKLRVPIVGKEGAKVPVSVAAPKGYKLATSADGVVLRRLGDIEHGGKRALPVEHLIKFEPVTRRYAVLVRTDAAGIPVEIFGTRQAITNDKGVAAFLYEGTPGDELQVRLVTDERQELRPQNPVQSFMLAPRPEAYLVKEHFSVVKRDKKKGPKLRLGPKRL